MAVSSEQYRGLNLKQLLDKLNEMYDREDTIIKETKKLKAEYDRLQEDKEMIQIMYMYASNRINNKKNEQDENITKQD